MRYLNKVYKRRIVDNTDWLSEDHDELAERAYMRRQKLAKMKLARWRLIKILAEN